MTPRPIKVQAEMPIKKVTVVFTVRTSSREKTVEAWVQEGMERILKKRDKKLYGDYDIQLVLAERISGEAKTRLRLDLFSELLDRFLEKIEQHYDDRLQRLEECCEAIEGSLEEEKP